MFSGMVDCNAAVHVSDFKRFKLCQGYNQVQLGTFTFLFLFSSTDCKKLL